MRRTDRIVAVRMTLCTIIILLSGCKTSQVTVRPVPEARLVDGVYEGSHAQLPNIARVRVTIKDNRIAHIEIVSHLAWKGKKAELPIIERIIESQSTEVDAVTGATNSSQVLMKAVQRAIEKAYQKQQSAGYDEGGG